MTKVHDLSISTTYTKPCLKFTTGLCNPIGKGKATASGSQPVEKGNKNTQMMQGQALCFGSGLDPSELPKPPVSPYISGHIATPTQPTVVAPNHHQLQVPSELLSAS